VLRADARALDASYQALVTTVKPLQRTLLDGGRDRGFAAAHRLASRHYGRNLVADLDEVGPLDVQTRVAVARGSETLRRSLNAIGDALNGIRDASYTRSFSLFDQASVVSRSRSTRSATLSLRFAISCSSIRPWRALQRPARHCDRLRHGANYERPTPDQGAVQRRRAPPKSTITRI